MPDGAAALVTAVDSSLIYPRRLSEILIRLRPAHVLLEGSATREILLSMMPMDQAARLTARLGHPATADPFSVLARVDFSKATTRAALFDFFGVGLPTEEAKYVAPTRTEVTPRFGLFGHQSHALRRVEFLLSQEPRRVLLHMPTGSGKTRTAMNIVANYLRGRDKGVVVWLAHSEELCEQAAEEFTKAWESLGSRPLSLVRHWGANEEDLRAVHDGLVIAGLRKAYSTLVRDDLQLRALAAKDPFVVMDEAHQAIARTYRLLLELLMRPGGDSQLLGLSATPGRTWNDPDADRELSQFFGSRKVSLRIPGFDNPVSYLIDAGYLARPTYRFVESASGVTLSDQEVRKLSETFELPATVLERLAADQQRNLLIVHHAEDLLRRHRRVILFAASVQQSDLLAAVLAARGHRASSITSKSGAERAETIAAFKDEEAGPKILCNFGVLTTGFDAPKTSAALISRPTSSLVLYSQMIGRAMRGTSAGGNASCEIVTVVDPRLPGFGSVMQAFTNWEDVWKSEDI
jgi:superfamily II DNA or RNA helicase